MSENKLFENTVCLAVTFHQPGKHRRLKSGEVEVRKTGASDFFSKADQSQLGVSKQIFDNKHHANASRIGHDFHSWLEKRALDSPLRRGTYLVPLDFLDEVYARIDEDQAKYEAEADALVEVFEKVKDDARARLKELYKESDYYSRQRLRRAFWVERKLFDFSPPGENKLSESIYEQEKKRWSETFAEAEDEVRQALRESCRNLVSHLAERLTPAADGKKKRLHASAVEKVLEFFELFDRRNILNDAELKKLVKYARRVLSGGEFLPEALRENDLLRDTVREEMEGVKTKLDALITSGPRRAISFEEE